MRTYYEEISSLVNSGKLEIRLILSPPRTGSTLMEACFWMNPGVEAQCHEPFVRLGYYGEGAESGYQAIYESIGSSDLSKREGTTTLVAKEMSHWLATSGEFERFLPLVKDPVILLIRNPLLTAESRLVKVLEILYMRERPVLQDWLLDRYPHFRGKHVRAGVDNKSPLALQQSLLDFHAQNNDYVEWRVMVEEKMKEKDYRIFGEILQLDRILPLTGSGWGGLLIEMEFLERHNRQFAVVDGTEYRLSPRYIAQELCTRWGLVFDDAMLQWRGNEIAQLHTRQEKAHYRVWYDTLITSRGIKPPTEVPPKLGAFPDFLARHLVEVDLPIYFKVFNHEYRVRSEGKLLDQEISSDGKTLRDIDPIFATLSEPQLMFDPEFRAKNADYGNILELIGTIEPMGKEGSIAVDFKGRRT